MISLDGVRAKVEQGVQEIIVPLLISKGIQTHKKHWRQCDCTWCSKKRQVTAGIAGVIEPCRDVRQWARRQLIVKAREELRFEETR